MSSKQLIMNGAICEYIRVDESIEFFCARCKKRKISKKYAQYKEDGIIKRLCNGCYGRLLSIQNEQ